MDGFIILMVGMVLLMHHMCQNSKTWVVYCVNDTSMKPVI